MAHGRAFHGALRSRAHQDPTRLAQQPPLHPQIQDRALLRCTDAGPDLLGGTSQDLISANYRSGWQSRTIAA